VLAHGADEDRRFSLGKSLILQKPANGTTGRLPPPLA
jgi:hypothetical protein